MPSRDVAALIAGVLAVIALAATWAADILTFRRPRHECPTINHGFWKRMKRRRSHRRFTQTLRCDPDTFDPILQQITLIYEQRFGRPRHNAIFGIDVRLAVTLYYLGRGKAMEDAATQFGMSKSSAVRYVTCNGVWIGISCAYICCDNAPALLFRYITEIETVLASMSNEVVAFPEKHDTDSWDRIASRFQQKHGGTGHPDVAGAIDGTLIQINRPKYYDGFYCRKG
jgi:hypothetical protein